MDDYAAFRFAQPKPHTRLIHMSWLLSNTEAFFPDDSKALILARRKITPDSTFLNYTGQLVSEKNLSFVKAAKIVIKDNKYISSFEESPTSLAHLESSGAEEKGRGYRQKRTPSWKKDYTTVPSDTNKPTARKTRKRSPSVSSDEDNVTTYISAPQKCKITPTTTGINERKKSNEDSSPQLNDENCMLRSNAEKLLFPEEEEYQEQRIQSAPVVGLPTNKDAVGVAPMYEEGYRPDFVDLVPSFRDDKDNDMESCSNINSAAPINHFNHQRFNYRSPRKNRGPSRYEQYPYYYGPLNRGNREPNSPYNNSYSTQQHACNNMYQEQARLESHHTGYESASNVMATSVNRLAPTNNNKQQTNKQHQTLPLNSTPPNSTFQLEKEHNEEGEKAVLLKELRDGSLFGKRAEDMSLSEFKGATMLGLSYLIKLVEGTQYGEKSNNPPKHKPNKNFFSEEMDVENKDDLSLFPFKELFPLKSLHDLIFLDDQLKKSSSLLKQLKEAAKEYLKKNMKKKICTASLTRMLLRAFITTRLSGELCYAGGNPHKHTFNTHKLVSVIKFAVKENKKHVKDNEIEEIMQLWIQKWKNRKVEELVEVDPLEVISPGAGPIAAAAASTSETNHQSVSEEEDDDDDDEAYNPIPLLK